MHCPSGACLRAACRLLACWVASLGWSATGTAEEVELRVRVEWGGVAAQRWLGTLELSEGRLEELVPLGVEADEAGSIWLEGGQVRVQSLSERTYDGFDVSVRAPRHARWIVKLAPKDGPMDAPPVEVPLEVLFAEQASVELPESGASLVMRRVPGDKLRVDVRRGHLVFAPGEKWSLYVQPHLLGIPSGTRLRLTGELRLARSSQASWTGMGETWVAEDGTVAGIEFELVLPRQEGVYDLHLELVRRGLPSRLALKQTIAERVVQLVVVGEEANEARPPPPEHVVLEIDPANPGWWKRWTNMPWLPGLRRGPLGSGSTERWQYEPSRVLMQLGPGGREPKIDWEAYPLAVHVPGQPHILELEYATQQPQSLGVSILEPNAAGRLSPIGLDAGVYVSGSAAASAGMAQYRLVFWPQTRSPLLLLTNRQEGTRPAYGRMRVLGPKPPTVPMPLARAQERAALPRPFAGIAEGGRLLAAYYDRPLFPASFGAEEARDPESGRAIHDWQTFYQGAVRLVEHLHYTGRNGLMLAVLADGSAIYPTRLVEATPRYDTGVYHSRGQDPLRKDVLELLLRLFDRERLSLIPAVHFTTPLAALEAMRRDPQQAAGLELVGSKGQTWLAERGARSGLAPYYNPLDLRVQQAVQEVLREIVERYGEHPSLAGVAVILSADGYAQLPGVEWGLDAQTLARFARETRTVLPEGVEEQRQAVLHEPLRRQWIAWRAQTLSRAMARMQRELGRLRSGLKLYMCGTSMFDRPELQALLEPRAGKGAQVAEALAAVGYLPEYWPASGDVVWVRPLREAPPALAADQAGIASVNQAAELDDWCSRQMFAACSIYHPPLLGRVPSFDARGPFPDSRVWLVSQLAPGGAESRRRLAQALAAFDARAVFAGGWLLPQGEEAAQRNLVQVFRGLPDQPLALLEGVPQPLVARVLREPGSTLLCVVNDSPWQVGGAVEIRAAVGTTATSLSPEIPAPAMPAEMESCLWRFELPAYDAAAIRFSSPAEFAHWEVDVPDQAVAELEERLRELWARAAVLRKPPRREAMANAGFEESADAQGRIPFWQTDGEVELDPGVRHEGKQSVVMRAGKRPARLRTPALDPPRLGHAEVTAWMRTTAAVGSLRVRLMLETTHGGAAMRRTAVPSAAPGADWTQVSFTFRDLPTFGLGKVRFRFEVEGEGELWIDDVEWFDLTLSDQQRKEVSKAILLAQYKFEQQAYRDCLAALDAYWPRLLSSTVELAPYTVARQPEREAARNADTPPPPGMLERVRQLLPFLR